MILQIFENPYGISQNYPVEHNKRKEIVNVKLSRNHRKNI